MNRKVEKDSIVGNSIYLSKVPMYSIRREPLVTPRRETSVRVLVDPQSGLNQYTHSSQCNEILYTCEYGTHVLND